MRNKKLWKNLMLVTTLTVALGTVSATALAEDDVTLARGTQVTAFASEGDIDGGIAVGTGRADSSRSNSTRSRAGRADCSRSYRTRGSSSRSNIPRGRHNCQGRSFHTRSKSGNSRRNSKFTDI